MRIVLAAYVVLINLIGLALMGTDKRRARRHQRRIPERVLFLTAIFFGSVGILTGMYLFRHKTRKLRFSIGIPVILVLQLIAASLLFLWNAQQVESPSQVVEYELDRIRDLDEETITAFISYENLVNSNLPAGEINADTADAVKEFFRQFTYHIHNETINGNEATVTVQIANIDTHALARDLCTEILKSSVAIYPEDEPFTTGDYYRLLLDTLLDNSYDTVVTTALFHLQEENHSWIILADETLEDELVSGFITYVNDPYLLSASEVLTIHLDALKDLDAEEWRQYLGIDDVFATYNTTYAEQIDEEYVQQLADTFDYEILSCEENGPYAEAQIRIHSIDMDEVLSEYRSSLIAYAATTESNWDSDVVISDKTAGMLLRAIQENTASVDTEVRQVISNNGYTWEVYFNSDFIEALMGNMNAAIEAFTS